MMKLGIDGQSRVPLVGDTYRSYQVTSDAVLYTEGEITALTRDKKSPYGVTCTKADNRGYIGKLISASVRQLQRRTTPAKNKPTKEEEELLNCEVSTDYHEMGIHKGYIADVGYNSDDNETQMDIIYEDQDIRTTSVSEIMNQRELRPKGEDCDPEEAFTLKKIRPRPRGHNGRKRQNNNQGATLVSPNGRAIHIALAQTRSRQNTGKKTRADAAKKKAARKRAIQQRRNAQEGTQRTAFTEPSVFAYRAMSTGKRRHSERVAPGLGPGPVGGVKER